MSIDDDCCIAGFRAPAALRDGVPVSGNDERLIAIGRYVREVCGGDVAEVAFTVADDYQHWGAATLLLRELVAIARERRVRKFVALVRPTTPGSATSNAELPSSIRWLSS